MGEFVISGSYSGYVFMGCALGKFETREGKMRDFYNMYVISPVSDFKSEDYSAYGFKAEKKSCVNASVWNGLQPGDRVILYFDDKGRVIQSALDMD